MKKNVFGRQFKRDTNERKALFKGLMTSLVMHERIQTTEEKAKSIKGNVEKLVTKALKKGENAKRELLPYLKEDAVKKMIADIAPRFANRRGGYTRIIKLGRRFGDNASVVVLEWVELGSLDKELSVKTSKKHDAKAVVVKDSAASVKSKKSKIDESKKPKAEKRKESKKTKPTKRTRKENKEK